MKTPLTRNEILVGARLGAYEIVRFIGHGGTASVFEARHVALGKPVAVKILHEHLANDAEISGRFLREGKVTAKLRHPNAVEVLDVGEERGVAYLVMDLLEGTSLRAHLALHRLLSLDDALALLLPIAAALSHAHGMGIVHRDVKPSNIFLATDARGTVVPKLLDFGLSKIVDGVGDKPLTSQNVMMGTLLYMAPEQTMGGRFASPRSDLYSLAAVLYECVTGQTPFFADGFYELVEAVRTSAVKPPSLLNPRLPEAFDDVVLRALHRDPEKRHPSVKQLAAKLLAFAGPDIEAAWRRDFIDAPSGSTAVARPAKIEREPSPEPAPSAPRLVRPLTTPKAAGPPMDWIVPFPKPRDEIADAKHFRSTWLTASQATIKNRGLDDRYKAAIDAAYRDRVLGAVPGVWLPMDVARAHYTACDRLDLPTSDLIEIGMAATQRANATTLQFMTRLAQGVGATPWTILAQTPRLWAHTTDDGAIGVARLGPKEAHVEIIGYPLADIRYNRVSMRGIVAAVVELFCKKAYVKEIPSLCDHRCLGLRVSWV